MLTIHNLHASIEDKKILNGIDLQINAGELFFLLGPSGCGKSTLLRLIAGLHEPTTGKVFFNDKDEPQLHGASGITRNFKPKPSFHAIAIMKRTKSCAACGKANASNISRPSAVPRTAG